MSKVNIIHLSLLVISFLCISQSLETLRQGGLREVYGRCMGGFREVYGRFTSFYGVHPVSWPRKTRTRESWQSCWHNRILNRLAVWFVYKAWKLETRLLLETRNWNTPHGDQAGGKVIHMVKDESVTRITHWFSRLWNRWLIWWELIFVFNISATAGLASNSQQQCLWSLQLISDRW